MIKVALAGLGAIGATVAERLLAGVPGIELVGVSDTHEPTLRQVLSTLGCSGLTGDLGRHARNADLIIDCSASSGFLDVAQIAIAESCDLLTVNSATLVDHPEIADRCAGNGCRITVATGALAGFDAVRAAAEGRIDRVVIRTRKNPRAFAGAPHVVQNGIDLTGLTEALLLFEGSVRMAARGFPDNVNVAAGLSLAGIGPDRTETEIWADPAVERNTHVIEVESDSTRFSIQIAGIPSPKNPRTGLLTPNSVVAALRAMAAPVRVGS
ncbi:aspartate dehydrogenase [Pacificispira sp.]|uniref:aspartate dehydrogenase n=1 Tax=Pacificispira sp. TaxID=2888761 RepID=UPI003BACA7C4